MPVNYYPNATEQELVALLESLQRRATTGQIYMSTYAGDQQVRSFTGAATVHVEIKRVLYSLSLLNSTYTNPYSQRVRRVAPSYY